jgi:sugar lactone lactonase YvrE
VQAQERQWSTVVQGPGSINSTTVSRVLEVSHSYVYSDVLVQSVSVDNSGDIYILDSGNFRVTKWTPGALVGSIVAGGNGLGSNANQINWPYGMFVEPNTSTIWIADTHNNRIVKWSSPSTSVIVCGSYGSNSNQFNYPNGLFVDTTSSNTLYVADTGNQRIQKWLSGATSGTTVAGQSGVAGTGFNQLNSPQTLIVDTSGNMFISDVGNNRIMRWPAGSNYGLPIAGSTTSGSMPYELWTPQGIDFDSSGSLYVADLRNSRVQQFSISCRK